MNFQWFSDDTSNCHTGVQRGVWILKDDLHFSTQSAHITFIERRDALSFERDFTCCRLDQAKNGPSCGRLPTAAFPNQAQRFPSVESEADVVDSVDIPDRLRKHTAFNGKVLFEVLDLK